MSPAPLLTRIEFPESTISSICEGEDQWRSISKRGWQSSHTISVMIESRNAGRIQRVRRVGLILAKSR